MRLSQTWKVHGPKFTPPMTRRDDSSSSSVLRPALSAKRLVKTVAPAPKRADALANVRAHCLSPCNNSPNRLNRRLTRFGLQLAQRFQVVFRTLFIGHQRFLKRQEVPPSVFRTL